jgi:hypothetical protein
MQPSGLLLRAEGRVGDVFLSQTHSGAVGAFLVVSFAVLGRGSRRRRRPS